MTTPTADEAPDLLDCGVCSFPVEDDEMLDCPEAGPCHIRCHRQSTCSDPMCDPWFEESR